MSVLNDMRAFALSVEDSITAPEIFQIMVEDVAFSYNVSHATSAAILIASWSFCNTSDKSLKDFLQHWVEDQCGTHFDD